MWISKKRFDAVIKAAKRSFAVSAFNASKITRLTASMATVSQSMDWDLRQSLQIMRARARSLSVNNDYAKKFLQMCKTHVVGPNGFRLQPNVSEVSTNGTMIKDGLANRAITDAFLDWCSQGQCDVTGQHSFFDICNLAIASVARDGETLIRKVYGRGKYGFQLQILDINRLDILKNQELTNNGMIKMGVETDKYGAPVAYHVLRRHPGDTPYYTMEGSFWERVPAEDMYHLFVAERPEQHRGIPWMHTAILRLQNLGGYEEAAVVAARVGASKMGFFTTPDGDATPLMDTTDDTATPMTEAEPGVFEVLPKGTSFEPFNPDYPHQQFGDFVKASLRGVASGLGVAYNTLSNDLEGVNFSSIRAGVLEERDNWMAIQKWFIENFLNDLYSTWLQYAMLKKAIVMPNGSPLPISKLEKFDNAKWHGRRWQWIDPLKDAEANVLAVNNGFKSRKKVAAESGTDFEETLYELADEEKLIKKLGVSIEQPAAKVAPQQIGTATPAKPGKAPPPDSPEGE